MWDTKTNSTRLTSGEGSFMQVMKPFRVEVARATQTVEDETSSKHPRLTTEGPTINELMQERGKAQRRSSRKFSATSANRYCKQHQSSNAF